MHKEKMEPAGLILSEDCLQKKFGSAMGMMAFCFSEAEIEAAKKNQIWPKISRGKIEIDANLVKTIEDGIEKFNMQNNFIFVESTLSIEKYYKASDIFVLPSLREGLPNALLEAMSTALPCVSSDLKGVTDYLISDKKEGLIFAPGDVESLCKAIYALLNDRNMAKELGRNAREKILDKFSIDKVDTMIIQVNKFNEYINIFILI